LSLAVIVSVLDPSFALAQSAPSNTTVVTKPVKKSASDRRKALDEETAQKQKRLEESDKQALEAVEMRNRKRADCRKQASEQKLHYMKRVRFIRKCMSSGSPQ